MTDIPKEVLEEAMPVWLSACQTNPSDAVRIIANFALSRDKRAAEIARNEGAARSGSTSWEQGFRWAATTIATQIECYDTPTGQEDAPTYTPCGGCGATHPDQRCIGCFHAFTPDDPVAAYRHTGQEDGP